MAEIPVEIPSYKTSPLKYGRGGEVFTSGVRISDLEQRDFYALIGAGGLSRVPMNDMHPTTYAVPGIEKVVIKPDSLIVRVTDPETVEQVTQWLKTFMTNNAEARARMETQLRTPNTRRAAVPEVETPVEGENRIVRENISASVWRAMQLPQSERHLIQSSDPDDSIFSIEGVSQVEFPMPGVVRIQVSGAEAKQRTNDWIDTFIAART